MTLLPNFCVKYLDKLGVSKIKRLRDEKMKIRVNYCLRNLNSPEMKNNKGVNYKKKNTG